MAITVGCKFETGRSLRAKAITPMPDLKLPVRLIEKVEVLKIRMFKRQHRISGKVYPTKVTGEEKRAYYKQGRAYRSAPFPAKALS